MMQQRYPAMMRWLHWIMAIIILGMICVGWYMTSIDDSVSYQRTLYFWHKSFGVLVIFLIVARVLTRYLLKPPKLPETLPFIIRFVACFSHFLLYLFMIVVPFSGYIMANPHGVPFFGLTHMPVIFDKVNRWTELAHDLHKVLAYTLLGLIVVHVLAVIYHQLDKNPLHRVWQRMKL